MAIFSPTIQGMMREKLITDGLKRVLNTNPSEMDSAIANIEINITLHSGAQPTANQVRNDWNTYKNTVLAYNTSSYFNMYESANNTYAADPVYIRSVNTGTAEWAILWGANNSYGGRYSIIGANGGYGYDGLIPATVFIVVPVSDLTTTTGVVKVLSTSVDPAVTSTTYITNLSLALAQV